MNRVSRKRIIPHSAAIPALMTCAAALVFSAAASAQAGSGQRAAGLRAAVSLATDSVHNGLLQTQSGAAFRASVDFEHASGFFVGAAATNVDYAFDDQLASQRNSQQLAYVGNIVEREAGLGWLVAAHADGYAV